MTAALSPPCGASVAPDVIRDTTAFDAAVLEGACSPPQSPPRPLDCDLRLPGQQLLWVAAPKPAHSCDVRHSISLFSLSFYKIVLLCNADTVLTMFNRSGLSFTKQLRKFLRPNFVS